LIASAWEVVRIPGNSALAYERALRRAERADRLKVEFKPSPPANYVPRPLVLRGAAHYRAGEFERTRELLTKAWETDGDNPVVLAFLAMTHHRLSDEGPARDFLERLQLLMAARPKQWDWGGQQDLRDLACEAGVLVGQ
jgi:Flp pilus assembly protein TadD